MIRWLMVQCRKILSRQFGRCENIGYYSIPLTRPVTVTASDDFVVAIKLTTPGYNFPIPVDITTGPKESGLCFLSVNGISWVPIGEGTTIPYDVAIRARITKGDVSRWPEVYEIMLNENGDDELSLLRRFRDEALELQPWGKRWVQLLYNNSEEIANLMLEDPLLTAEAGKIIDQLIPVVQSYLENKEMKLSVEQLDSILILLSCFESKASLGLKRVISTFRSDLSRRDILSQRGVIVD